MARIIDHSREVEREVRGKMVVQLNRIGVMGERFTKIRITEEDRILYDVMRSEITFEVDAEKLLVRYGSNETYTIFQELGTETIKPMYALRGALDDIRQELR